jgi:hypothetical protein
LGSEREGKSFSSACRASGIKKQIPAAPSQNPGTRQELSRSPRDFFRWLGTDLESFSENILAGALETGFDKRCYL